MGRRSYEIEHVLMTADAVGSVWTYAMELTQGLARLGVRTTLAVMGPLPTQLQLEEATQIPGLTLHTAPYKLEWMNGPWREVDAAGDWLLALAEREQPDVVHLNGYAHAGLPWRQPTVVACHGDVLSCSQAVHGDQAPMADWMEYARRVRAGLHSAGLVVAPTHATLTEVQANYGTLDGARVVHHGRSASPFAPGDKRPMIFSAGRLGDPAKNVDVLQAIAGDLDWPVYLAGDYGEARPRAGSVHYLGWLCVSAMSAWLGRAGIFALPAKYEPSGWSVLEAALSGCALVLSDLPTLRELWDGAALFVNPNDPDQLTETLNDLANDEGARHRLARAAQTRVSRYSGTALACNMLFAYQDVRQANLVDVTAFRHPLVSMR